MGREVEPDAEISQRLDGFEPLDRVGGHRPAVRHDEVGVGAVVRSAHPPAQLVQLGEAESVRAVDHDGVGVGDVDPRLDDRGAHQHLESTVIEVEHRQLQVAFAHLSVRDPHLGVRSEVAHVGGNPLDVLDLVVHEEDLSAAADLALQGLAEHTRVPPANERLDRQPFRRWRGDEREVAKAGERHVEGAGDRRRGQGEHVDLGPQRLESFLLAHAEAVLLVDDHEPEPLEPDAAVQQLVGADDDVDGAGRETAYDLCLRVAGAETRELLDPHRPVREPVAERLMMLLGEQRGGDEHRDLLPGLHGDERGAHRDFGLAEADVAAHQAVHRRRPAHVVDHLPDRVRLIRRFLEREGGFEAVQVLGCHLERHPRPTRPPRLDLEQLGRDVRDPLRRAAPCPLPLAASQLVQRRGFRIHPGVARDEVQRSHRHVELVAVGVVDAQEFPVHATHRQHLETRVTSHAMCLVHHRRADPQLAQVAHQPFGVASAGAAAAALGGARAEELRLGDHRDGRRIDPRAVLECGNGHGESRAAPRELVPGLDQLRPQSVRTQGLGQDLPPSRRFRHEEAAAGLSGEEVLQKPDRPGRSPVDRQCRRRTRRERDGGAAPALALAASAQTHAAMRRERREQLLDRREYLVGSEHRPLAVVAPVLVPFPGVRPERLRRVVHVLGEDDDGAGRDEVEQASGLLEEQRQVVLDAGRPAPLADLPVHRAPRRIALEAPPPCAPKPRHRVAGGGVLAGGKQLDAIDPARRALAFRLEDAEAFYLVVEQVDAQRRVRPHGIEVEERAAHRVLAVLHHLAHAGVPGLIQAPAERVDIEAIAGPDPEPVALDEAARSDPPHRGGDRGHQHAGFEGRQPRDGFQPLGDDVLVRREEIVGQCLPVRESQDFDAVVKEELELRFEPVRGPVVRGDDQHRRVRPPGEARDGEAAGAAVQRGPRRA